MTAAYSSNKLLEAHSCGCVGPQNGEPLCPCQMRGVTIKDGRYIQVIDYGPVPTEAYKSVLASWLIDTEDGK